MEQPAPVPVRIHHAGALDETSCHWKVRAKGRRSDAELGCSHAAIDHSAAGLDPDIELISYLVHHLQTSSGRKYARFGRLGDIKPSITEARRVVR